MKTIQLLYIMIFSFLLYSTNSYGQIPSPQKTYLYDIDVFIKDSLNHSFGQNKKLPKGYELAALRALSHYPELKDSHIEFRFVKAKTAHTSRPKIGSMLNPFSKRKYQINISTEVSEVLDPGRLENLPYNAQIGVLGHELGHTAEYADLSFWQVIKLAWKYGFNKAYQQENENNTDHRTIDHNLGYQLLEWSKIASPLLDAVGRGENYLDPKEIEKILEKHPNYQ